MKFLQFKIPLLVLGRSYSAGDIASLPDELAKRYVPNAAAVIEPTDEQLANLSPSPLLPVAPIPDTDDDSDDATDKTQSGETDDDSENDLALFDFLSDDQSAALAGAGYKSSARITKAIQDGVDLTTVKHIGDATVNKFKKALKLN